MENTVSGGSSIYAIRCKANGKLYIGRSRDVLRRVQQHWQDKQCIVNLVRTGQRKGGLTDFEADFEKYGRDGFEVYVLETNVSVPDKQGREAAWINEYHTTDPRYGYNKQRGVNAPRSKIIYALPPNLSKVSPNQLIPKKEE